MHFEVAEVAECIQSGMFTNLLRADILLVVVILYERPPWYYITIIWPGMSLMLIRELVSALGSDICSEPTSSNPYGPDDSVSQRHNAMCIPWW
jgi:hypothetical protein